MCVYVCVCVCVCVCVGGGGGGGSCVNSSLLTIGEHTKVVLGDTWADLRYMTIVSLLSPRLTR